jgi:hypothetical protein
LETLDKFQNQDPELLKKGKELADYFKTHPQQTAELMKKAHSVLANTNSTPPVETTNTLLNLIRANPQIDNRALQALLRENGKELTTTRIAQLLNAAMSRGEITKADKKRNAWIIAESSQQPQEHSGADTQSLEDLSRQ